MLRFVRQVFNNIKYFFRQIIAENIVSKNFNRAVVLLVSFTVIMILVFSISLNLIFNIILMNITDDFNAKALNFVSGQLESKTNQVREYGLNLFINSKIQPLLYSSNPDIFTSQNTILSLAKEIGTTKLIHSMSIYNSVLDKYYYVGDNSSTYYDLKEHKDEIPGLNNNEV